MVRALSALFTAAILMLPISSCIRKLGKGSDSKGASGTSFGVTLTIPEKVAERMGYAGLFEMTTTSSGSPVESPTATVGMQARQRVFQRQVSFQGNQAGQLLLDKDGEGKYMEKSEVLSNLMIKLIATDGTVIYSGGATQSSVTLVEGINRIAFTMDCLAKAICAELENLVILPVTPPDPTSTPSAGSEVGSEGPAAAKTPVAATGSAVAAKLCRCAVYENSCIIWQPGQAYVIESKPAQDCVPEFCKTGFSEATYTKCGGASKVTFSQDI